MTAPATTLDDLLSRWDDEAYADALDELDYLVEEQLTWLQATAEDEDDRLTVADVGHLRDGLTRAVAAVRNADQKRRDNLRSGL